MIRTQTKAIADLAMTADERELIRIYNSVDDERRDIMFRTLQHFAAGAKAGMSLEEVVATSPGARYLAARGSK